MHATAASDSGILTPRRDRWRDQPWWQVAVGVAAVVAGVVAVWVTLPADFLRYPAWLAAQKADFVVGPVLTGLYWLRRRPQSRFGPMLMCWGLVGALYILQSSTDSWLFSIGLFWEKVFGLATYVLILAFPTGRLDRTSKTILVAGVITVLALATAIQLLLPQVGGGGSISSCLSLCPLNELAITSNPELAADLFEAFRFAVLGLAVAVAAVVVRRFVTGTPPQRRALAVGTPVALLFLVCEILYQLLGIVGAEDSDLYGVVIWVFVAARAAVWYGFLFALISAELFAARAMERLVEQSLRHPSKHELEVMLREPLGDPDLRLEFLGRASGSSDGWRGTQPGPDRDVTVIRRDGTPAVAIVHDAQLNDDPELLDAAGAVALLVAENADLDAGWKQAVGELQRSRTRLVRTADLERRKFERNLHDGAQQQLMAIKLWLDIVADEGTIDDRTRDRLGMLAGNVQSALDEVRAVAQGLYPPLLSDSGLTAALKEVQRRTPVPVNVDALGIERYSTEVESAVYYSSLEAIQNATKHGGQGVQISVTVREDNDHLRFEIEDDGVGFDPVSVTGTGLQNIQDRVGALGGEVDIRTAPGKGTRLSGRVPLSTASQL